MIRTMNSDIIGQNYDPFLKLETNRARILYIFNVEENIGEH